MRSKLEGSSTAFYPAQLHKITIQILCIEITDVLPKFVESKIK